MGGSGALSGLWGVGGRVRWGSPVTHGLERGGQRWQAAAWRGLRSPQYTHP